MPDTDHRLALDAPAKINLYLHVTGRRDDGYHLLDSLVAFSEHGDRLTVEPAEELSLRIGGAFAGGLAADRDNLILRAGRALREAFGVRQGAALTLEKNLPVSSGIGGGSADAAAALRLLAEQWRIDDDQERLAEVGLPVGADVPVCLASTTSRMTGIGEIVEHAGPLPPCGVVLVNGGEGVSTPSVFAARKGPYSKPPAWQAADDFEGFARALKDRSNGLALAAQTVSPVISDVLTALEKTEGCALARVSGSGGTCFGLFADPTLAQAAAGDISTRYPQWWSVATRFRAGRPEITTG